MIGSTRLVGAQVDPGGIIGIRHRRVRNSTYQVRIGVCSKIFHCVSFDADFKLLKIRGLVIITNREAVSGEFIRK